MSAVLIADVQPFTRRGVCPALSAPMQTGDGLLSRIAFTAAISPAALADLCGLATRHGNGLLDITARGGIQFRGLTRESAVTLEADVLALKLPLRQGLAVETSPIAGVDATEIADPRKIVSRISEGATELHLHDRLAAKMSVVIDGGGYVAIDNLLADIRLKATLINGEMRWQLMLGGTRETALNCGLVRTDDASGIVVDLLSVLAEHGPNARGRDLDIDTIRRICGERLIEQPATASDIHRSPVMRFPSSRLWRLANDLYAAVVTPAFGQATSDALSVLCRYASELGIQSVRPGSGHGLYFVGGKQECEALLGHASEAGFVVGDGDPRSSIAVCAGKPACASAFLATRELAHHAAVECASLLDGSFTLHLSGCGKGCAHPGSALLALSGREDGFALNVSGRVCDAPELILPFSQQKAALSRLARLYEKEHKPGENARTLLARLGMQRIVAALRQDDR